MADLIKRDSALKGYDTVLSILDSAVHAVSETKAIVLQYGSEPERHWIPCSETEDLPKHEVLCCDKYGEELIGWLSYSDDQWLCESDCEMMYDPIAWREKPEPWRGEEHEHTMEEFMYGQDMGNPDDGSL